MSNQVHVPMRMCVVTREKLPKKGLLRFVLNSDEKKIVLDKGERVRGRGVNLKPEMEIFELALKRKVFEREFNIKISETELANLRKEVDDYINLKYREKVVVRVTKENLDKLKQN